MGLVEKNIHCVWGNPDYTSHKSGTFFLLKSTMLADFGKFPIEYEVHQPACIRGKWVMPAPFFFQTHPVQY